MSGPVNKIVKSDLWNNKPARVDRINLLNLQMQTINETCTQYGLFKCVNCFYLLPICFGHLDVHLDFKTKPRAEIKFFQRVTCMKDIQYMY